MPGIAYAWLSIGVELSLTFARSMLGIDQWNLCRIPVTNHVLLLVVICCCCCCYSYLLLVIVVLTIVSSVSGQFRRQVSASAWVRHTTSADDSAPSTSFTAAGARAWRRALAKVSAKTSIHQNPVAARCSTERPAPVVIKSESNYKICVKGQR